MRLIRGGLFKGGGLTQLFIFLNRRRLFIRIQRGNAKSKPKRHAGFNIHHQQHLYPHLMRQYQYHQLHCHLQLRLHPPLHYFSSNRTSKVVQSDPWLCILQICFATCTPVQGKSFYGHTAHFPVFHLKWMRWYIYPVYGHISLFVNDPAMIQQRSSDVQQHLGSSSQGLRVTSKLRPGAKVQTNCSASFFRTVLALKLGCHLKPSRAYLTDHEGFPQTLIFLRLGFRKYKCWILPCFTLPFLCMKSSCANALNLEDNLDLKLEDNLDNHH